MKKKIISAAAVILIIAVVLCALNELFMPKYMTQVPEGALISEYYLEAAPHDVLFVGDCEVYENFVPDTLWNEFGVTSYIRGSAQQLIWQSYYLLEEMLEKETPKVVVFNVLSLKYDTPQNEAYNRLNLDGMKLSAHKLKAIKASMTEGEGFMSYIFPLLRYHERWAELSEEDLKYFGRRDVVSDSGYLMNVGIKPAADIPEGRPLSDYSFGPSAMSYMDKITGLCAAKGVKLVLVKAPSLYPFWYDQWNEQVEEYAREKGLDYINFLELTDEIGLDYNTDTYDGGLHLNLYGAEKLSRYFGEWLIDNYDLADHRSSGAEEALVRLWERKTEVFNNRKETLENEKDD